MELPEYWGRFDAPAAHAVRAQLLLAMLLAAVMLPFLLNHPLPTHRVMLDFRQAPGEIVRYHRLEIEPDSTVRIDGEKVGFVELRERLDLIEATSGDWVDFRPHAEARYEMVLEVFAVTKRARLERLRFDNSAFWRAMDRGGGR